MSPSATERRAVASVRPATEADLPAIEQMAREFADHVNAIDGSEALDPALVARIGSLAFGPEPLCRIELAEVAGTPVGYMIYFIGIDTNEFTPVLHIADLFVREAWRDRGIGRVLTERAASISRERGGKTLVWTVWTKNAAALAFYRRLGAQPWNEALLMRWKPGGGD